MTLCGYIYIPVCSGRGDTVVGCGVGGVSGRVESETREGGRSGNTWYGGDAVMGVGTEYEEGTRVGPDVTCEYTLVSVAVLAAPAGGGGRN